MLDFTWIRLDRIVGTLLMILASGVHSLHQRRHRSRNVVASFGVKRACQRLVCLRLMGLDISQVPDITIRIAQNHYLNGRCGLDAAAQRCKQLAWNSHEDNIPDGPCLELELRRDCLIWNLCQCIQHGGTLNPSFCNPALSGGQDARRLAVTLSYFGGTSVLEFS